MARTGKEAGEKADKSYEQTYENCMKRCPTPEPVRVKPNNQRLDDKQKGGPEIPPQTKTEEKKNGKSETKTEENKNGKSEHAAVDKNKESLGGIGNTVSSPSPSANSESLPSPGKTFDPNDPRCVVNDPPPEECRGGKAAIDQLFEQLQCDIGWDNPYDSLSQFCKSLVQSANNFDPITVPQSNAKLNEVPAFASRLATEINGLNLSGRPQRVLSSDEKDKIKRLMDQNVIWPHLNEPTRSALRNLAE